MDHNQSKTCFENLMKYWSTLNEIKYICEVLGGSWIMRLLSFEDFQEVCSFVKIHNTCLNFGYREPFVVLVTMKSYFFVFRWYRNISFFVFWHPKSFIFLCFGAEGILVSTFRTICGQFLKCSGRKARICDIQCQKHANNDN